MGLEIDDFEESEFRVKKTNPDAFAPGGCQRGRLWAGQSVPD